MSERTLRRRRFLLLGGAGLASALAGCPGGNGGTETTPVGGTSVDTTTTTVRPTTTLLPTTTVEDTTTTTATPTADGTTTTPPPTTVTTTATPVPVSTQYEDAVLSESDSEPAGFGAATAFDETTALIGAPGAARDGSGTGNVYVYIRETGLWRLEDVIVPDQGSSGEAFGSAVAVEGDVAVVGAPPADGSSDATGSAYAFSRTQGVWSQEDLLTPDGLSTGTAYGETVAVTGSIGFVGAPAAGAVHTFSAYGGIWSHKATITGTDGDDDRFGSALDVQDTLVAIGAPGTSRDVGEDAGAVYVYESGAAGWTQQFTGTPAQSSSDARFGEGVAIGSNALVAGAPGADPRGDGSGAAYVFEAARGEWPQEDTLVPTDGDAGDAFGRSVALTEGTAIVGAPRDEDPNGQNAGSAYVFRRHAPDWRQDMKLLPETGKQDAGFGANVSVYGRSVIVGTTGGEGDSGAGYLFGW